MNKLHYNIKVTGRVQGVWFRKYARESALKVGVKGFVKNDNDRSVYVEVEGEIVQLTEFVTLLKKGSPLSRVSQVIFTEDVLVSFKDFEIRP